MTYATVHATIRAMLEANLAAAKALVDEYSITGRIADALTYDSEQNNAMYDRVRWSAEDYGAMLLLPLFASFCLFFCLWLLRGGSRIFVADERTKFPLRHVLQHNEGLWRLRGVTGSPRHEN